MREKRENLIKVNGFGGWDRGVVWGSNSVIWNRRTHIIHALGSRLSYLPTTHLFLSVFPSPSLLKKMLLVLHNNKSKTTKSSQMVYLYIFQKRRNDNHARCAMSIVHRIFLTNIFKVFPPLPAEGTDMITQRHNKGSTCPLQYPPNRSRRPSLPRSARTSRSSENRWERKFSLTSRSSPRPLWRLNDTISSTFF